MTEYLSPLLLTLSGFAGNFFIDRGFAYNNLTTPHECVVVQRGNHWRCVADRIADRQFQFANDGVGNRLDGDYAVWNDKSADGAALPRQGTPG
jgi:hypothetical protein